MQSFPQSIAFMYIDYCICTDKQELITLQHIKSNQINSIRSYNIAFPLKMTSRAGTNDRTSD